jgi:hypothetical protein
MNQNIRRGKIWVENGIVYYKYFDNSEKIKVNSREFTGEFIDKIDKIVLDKFRDEYKNFVSGMNSREFAEMMLREGDERTRANIIIKMERSGIPVPPMFYEVCEAKLSIKNYLQFYFSKTQLPLNINWETEYYNFKESFCEEFDSIHNIPPYHVFKNYYTDFTNIERRISELTDFDCDLMKFSHC